MLKTQRCFFMVQDRHINSERLHFKAESGFKKGVSQNPNCFNFIVCVDGEVDWQLGCDSMNFVTWS